MAAVTGTRVNTGQVVRTVSSTQEVCNVSHQDSCRQDHRTREDDEFQLFLHCMASSPSSSPYLVQPVQIHLLPHNDVT